MLWALGSYGVWIVELIYSWIRYSVGSIRWSIVQTIEAAICPTAELNCYCLRGQEPFVLVFAPAAIGVRTVGFVESKPSLCWWGPRREGVTP